MRMNQRRFHVFTRPPEREGVGGGLGSTGGQGLWEGREGAERQSERREGGAGGAKNKAMRGKTDKQGQAGLGAPGSRPPHFLTLSVSPGEPPPPMSGQGARMGSVPTSWGRQRESRQDQARREGRRMGCPHKPQATETGGVGKGQKAQGVGQKQRQRWKQQRGTRRDGGREGGREGGGKRGKKTSYIDMTLSLPGRPKISAWLQPVPSG